MTFALIACLACVGILLSWNTITHSKLYEDRISNVQNVYDRLAAWRYAYRAFTEHPLTGIGAWRMRAYIEEQEARGVDLSVMGMPAAIHPHNSLISQLAENGLLAVVPLCLLIWYFLREVAACVRFASTPVEKEFGIYAISAAFAIFAPALTDRALEWDKLNNLMFVIFAIVAAHRVNLMRARCPVEAVEVSVSPSPTTTEVVLP